MNVQRIAQCLLGALMAAAVGASAQDIPSKPLVFDADNRTAVARGTVDGRESVDLVFTAAGGERVTAILEAGAIGYFNLLPPGSDGEAMFIGSVEGNRYSGTLDAPGDYRFRIYQMRASARRGETTDYTLRVEVDRGEQAAGSAGFREVQSLHGISFEVTSPNRDRGNTLRIVPSGLVDDSEIVQPIDGIVVGAEVADLNIDQAPEIYVYVRPAGAGVGAGETTTLVAYASNRNRSLSTIALPPLEDVPGASEGYAGGDAMAVIESRFARRFPIGDGRYRQLQYRLVKGEASWMLEFERMTEF